jgi:hypothetical protein
MLSRSRVIASLERCGAGFESALREPRVAPRPEKIFQYPYEHAALSLTHQRTIVARTGESGENQALQRVVTAFS